MNAASGLIAEASSQTPFGLPSVFLKAPLRLPYVCSKTAVGLPWDCPGLLQDCSWATPCDNHKAAPRLQLGCLGPALGMPRVVKDRSHLQTTTHTVEDNCLGDQGGSPPLGRRDGRGQPPHPIGKQIAIYRTPHTVDLQNTTHTVDLQNTRHTVDEGRGEGGPSLLQNTRHTVDETGRWGVPPLVIYRTQDTL